MVLAMAAASAVEEPETPPISVFVKTFTCPRPPRKWPTRVAANATRRSVMPPTFIRPAASMKNGIAISR
jgi:hypothetical protein